METEHAEGPPPRVNDAFEAWFDRCSIFTNDIIAPQDVPRPEAPRFMAW